MHRIRISIPYYKQMGWEAVVLCVDEKFVSGYKDDLLNETIPGDIEVHKIKAWSQKLTSKIGIGSLSLRSYFNFKKAGTKLLAEKKFDLIFFSTTLFHVCALGRYWKKKFGVPFIIDMQDPWRNDFYINKPKAQRPPKFWVSYAINKKMEAYTMPHVGGLISVSQAYLDNLRSRYQALQHLPTLLLPFGVSIEDFQLVEKKNILPQIIKTKKINVVYMGAINKFFLPLIRAFFIAFSKFISRKEDYHFYFIGTNYAPHLVNKPVEKIGKELGLADIITEVPQRIPYFSALSTLMHADILFIPGSSDADYNASKVYNNIFAGKPIFSIFNEKSLVKNAINDTGSGIVVAVSDTDTQEELVQKIEKSIPEFAELHLRKISLKQDGLKKYLANTMAEKQIQFFNKVLMSQITLPCFLALNSHTA